MSVEPHKHCPICGTPIPLNELVCSPDCQKVCFLFSSFALFAYTVSNTYKYIKLVPIFAIKYV